MITQNLHPSKPMQALHDVIRYDAFQLLNNFQLHPLTKLYNSFPIITNLPFHVDAWLLRSQILGNIKWCGSLLDCGHRSASRLRLQ